MVMPKRKHSDEPLHRFNFMLSDATMERLEAAAFFERKSRSEIVEMAINREVDRLESIRKEPYPKR